VVTEWINIDLLSKNIRKYWICPLQIFTCNFLFNYNIIYKLSLNLGFLVCLQPIVNVRLSWKKYDDWVCWVHVCDTLKSVMLRACILMGMQAQNITPDSVSHTHAYALNQIRPNSFPLAGSYLHLFVQVESNQILISFFMQISNILFA